MAEEKGRGRGRPPRPGGALKVIPARLAPALVERLDRWCKRLGLTRSEAIRRAVEDLLDKESE